MCPVPSFILWVSSLVHAHPIRSFQVPPLFQRHGVFTLFVAWREFQKFFKCPVLPGMSCALVQTHSWKRVEWPSCTFITSLWWTVRRGSRVSISWKRHCRGHETHLEKGVRGDAWSRPYKLEGSPVLIRSLFQQLMMSIPIQASSVRTFCFGFGYVLLPVLAKFLGSHFLTGPHSADFHVARQSCQLTEM